MKQLYELNDFSGGVISNADLADIPEGASEISLNISPMGKMGAIEPINDNFEMMAGVPHITSMIVRDGVDDSTHNLAVNIRENFIYIPNYATDIKLADFVEIAEAGQLFDNPSGPLDASYTTASANELGKWNFYDHGDYSYYFSVIKTVPNYIYSLFSYCETSATTAYTAETDMPVMYACKAQYDNNNEIVLNYNNPLHIQEDLEHDDVISIKQFWAVKMAKELKFTATGEYTVIVLRKAKDSLGHTTSFSDMTVQFSKGGYLWGPLGSDLDLTNTNRGLFIGSATSKPHLLGMSKDDKNRVLDFLEESECTPPISATSMSNIDFMAVVPNQDWNDQNCHNLLCGIQGEAHLWAINRDWDAGAVSNFTNFHKSEKMTFADKGLGGIVTANGATNEESTMYCWDFEGWNIYQIEIPNGVGTIQGDADWAAEYKKTWSISLDDIPTDGFISKVEVSKAHGTNYLYVLLSRVGGLKAGDNVLLQITIAGDYEGPVSVDNGKVKILYKILPYQSVTAYTGHKRKKNWLGIPTDVNPTGSTTFYWSTVGQTPPPYENGDYADISHGPTYGDIPNMCWANTSSDDVTIDVAEDSLAIVETDSKDVCTFTLKPMGDTCFVTNSGQWRKAEQWPNMWPDGDDPDGWWADVVSNQVTTKASMMVRVSPNSLAGPDMVSQNFSSVTGDIRGTIMELYDKLTAFTAIGEFVSVPSIAGSYSDSDTADSIVRCATQIREQGNNTKLLAIQSAILDNESDADILALITSYKDEVELWDTGYTDPNNSWYWVPPTDYTTAYRKELYIFEKWNTIWLESGYWNWYAHNSSEFKTQMSMFKDLWAYINTLAGYDTTKTVGGYNVGIIHEKIGSNFPFEGGFDSMQAYEGPSGEQRILCQKQEDGKVLTTSMEYTFPAGIITEQVTGATFEFLDDINATSNDNNIFTHEEKEVITSVDASGNVTRTETGERADITEFASLIVGGDMVTAYAVDIPRTTANETDYPTGSAVMPLSLAGSSPNAYPSLLIASFTGDVLLRSFQFKNTSDGVAMSNPFDSGELAIGITPEAGAVFEPQGEQTADDAPFLVNDTVLYNTSFLYDGYQEGPLMGSPVTYTVDTAEGLASVNVRVNVSTQNPRITAVNLYSKKDPREKYRLVEQVEIDNEWLVQDAEGMPDANLSSTAFMTAGVYTSIEDKGRAGVSYEALNGISEVLKNTMVDYSESEELSGYLFVTKAYHPSVDNSEKYIFRSQPNKFSVFDWSKDYIGMPENIHSLKSCYNRLFAFSEKTMYQIDPHNLIVESKFDGMGIANQKSVTVADGVLYISNRNGVYIYGGGKFQHISQTIHDLWNEIFDKHPTAVPILANDKTYNSLLVMFDNAGSHSVDLTPSTAFSFSIDKRRWDVWELPRKIKSVCNSERNTLLISAEASSVAGYDVDGNPLTADQLVAYNLGLSYETIPINNRFSIYELHTGADKKKISWRTKKLTLGADSRDKKFKKVKFKGVSMYISEIEIDGVIYYYNKSGTMFSDATHSTQVATNQFKDEGQYKVVDIKKVGKYIQIKLDTDDSEENISSELESISLTYNLRSVK